MYSKKADIYAKIDEHILEVSGLNVITLHPHPIPRPIGNVDVYVILHMNVIITPLPPQSQTHRQRSMRSTAETRVLNGLEV